MGADRNKGVSLHRGLVKAFFLPQLFNTTIETSEKADDLQYRLTILLQQTLLTAYTNVSRGLFEQHKLIYSFMLCVEIMRQQGQLTDAEWNFFLRGAAGMEKVAEGETLPPVSAHSLSHCCEQRADRKQSEEGSVPWRSAEGGAILGGWQQRAGLSWGGWQGSRTGSLCSHWVHSREGELGLDVGPAQRPEATRGNRW